MFREKLGIITKENKERLEKSGNVEFVKNIQRKFHVYSNEKGTNHVPTAKRLMVSPTAGAYSSFRIK